MIHTDFELTALVFLFYLYECIFFLKPGEFAYTGVLTGEFKKWEYQPSGYTLLGRFPCIVNPLRVGVGIVILRQGDFVAGKSYTKSRLRAALRISKPSIQALRFLCSTLAFLLFAVLPYIVYRQLLAFLWKPLLAEVLLVHIAICIVFTLELRRWKKLRAQRLSKSLPLYFNLVAAIRCIDVLSQAIFDQLGKSAARQRPKSLGDTHGTT